MAKKVIIIGAGFSGLSAASFMARGGWEVHVVEKHAIPGGRARRLAENGFVFDMGPSWYWMPDVFERYFSRFGKRVSDFYTLQRLDPSYRIYWEKSVMDIPAGVDALRQLFNSIEPGAGLQLQKFLQEAAYKYAVGMQRLVFKPGLSVTEFIDRDVMAGVFKLDIFTSMQKHVRKFFTDARLRQILEFPVLFLGALPQDIPALYSLMNYADIAGGTWYPDGGMYRIVEGMYDVAVALGVTFHFNEAVDKITIEGGTAKGIHTHVTPGGNRNAESRERHADVIIGSADYHYIETELLPAHLRSYSDSYWEKRVMAPSCLLYYVGLNKRLQNIRHHSLFFDVPFDRHAAEIYVSPKWPSQPLFYVSATSVTDSTVAPPGCENLFFLVPVAAGLEGDTDELRARYFNIIAERFERHTGEKIRDAIIYYKSFAHSDFVNEYHSFKGNAYGLANTLYQTALLKPRCRSKKVSNLFYTGQLTVPGPGVPPSLISGEVVAGEVLKHFA